MEKGRREKGSGEGWRDKEEEGTWIEKVEWRIGKKEEEWRRQMGKNKGGWRGEKDNGKRNSKNWEKRGEKGEGKKEASKKRKGKRKKKELKKEEGRRKEMKVEWWKEIREGSKEKDRFVVFSWIKIFILNRIDVRTNSDHRNTQTWFIQTHS